MKDYPSIPKDIQNIPVYIFPKYDGSQIRVEWQYKKNNKDRFKFGTRHRLLDYNEKPLGEAVELFMSKYADDIEKVFDKEEYKQATLFCEFFGPSSFAGFHFNEKHDVIIFDIAPYKKGILPPSEFEKLFKHMNVCNSIYYGNINQNIVDSIRNGTFDGATFEGVVCKAPGKRENIMFKIKTKMWIDKLKEKCGNNKKLFEELL